jgi:hypothetical protein
MQPTAVGRCAIIRGILAPRLSGRSLGRIHPTMTERKVEAETLRYGLLAGCVTVAEAVAWADATIDAEAAPEIAIVDVALARRRSPAEVATLLEAVPGEADGVEVRRRLLGRMLRILDADPSRGGEIARSLYSLAVSGELPERDFGWQPYTLDDTFDLARSGVCGTHRDAVVELREYLERHAGERAP